MLGLRAGGRVVAHASGSKRPWGSGSSLSTAASSVTRPRVRQLSSRPRAGPCPLPAFTRATCVGGNSLPEGVGGCSFGRAADRHGPQRRHRHRQPQAFGPLGIEHLGVLPAPAPRLKSLKPPSIQ